MLSKPPRKETLPPRPASAERSSTKGSGSCPWAWRASLGRPSQHAVSAAAQRTGLVLVRSRLVSQGVAVLDLRARACWAVPPPPAFPTALPFQGQRVHGWGGWAGREFGAVFADAGTLWLQLGLLRQDLREVRRVDQQRERLRSASYLLQLRDGTTRLLTVRFTLGVALRRLAHNYDGLDELEDNPVAHVYVEPQGDHAAFLDRTDMRGSYEAWYADTLARLSIGFTPLIGQAKESASDEPDQ